jgi:hypothetical protein
MARRQEQEPQRDAAEALKLQAPTQEIAGARKKDERAADVDQLGTEQDVTAKTTGIWIEGTLIEEKESTGFVKTEGARSEDKLKALQQRAPMQPTAAKQAVTVTVMERSLEELPTPQRLYQERFQKRSIQTQVERMGDELHFTVYRDTPELQGKRQNAVLQQIGRDSVVMVVGKDQIGYKIPGGIDALKAQKK